MDKKEGRGKYTWADSRIYDGMWKDGKQHGEGLYIQKDGKARMGYWEDGKRIKWNDEDSKDRGLSN